MASPMLFVEGCILSIEFSRAIEHSVLIQYQIVVLGTGIVIMNAMTCRVFCLLRLSSVDESDFLSADVLSYTTPDEALTVIT